MRTREFNPSVVPALAAVAGSIETQVKEHGSLAGVPADAVVNVRSDVYLASEALRHLGKSDAAHFDNDTTTKVGEFRKEIDDATKFIPLWVKVAVAIALGLGTVIFGRTHLSYAQGASAELVAMVTIGAADMYGLSGDGMGTDLAGGDAALGLVVLALHAHLLSTAIGAKATSHPTSYGGDEAGLICDLLSNAAASKPVRPLDSAAAAAYLAGRDGVGIAGHGNAYLWLHLNLSHAQASAGCADMPRSATPSSRRCMKAFRRLASSAPTMP